MPDHTEKDRRPSLFLGLTGQLGGTNGVQADYNNDGRLDVFVMRGTTQVFRDLDVNQAIEVTEFAQDYRKLD
jgi:hypothetical protein